MENKSWVFYWYKHTFVYNLYSLLCKKINGFCSVLPYVDLAYFLLLHYYLG